MTTWFVQKFFGTPEPVLQSAEPVLQSVETKSEANTEEQYDIVSLPESCSNKDDAGLHVKIFPCAAITFIPKECGKCHKIVPRRGFCFQEWMKATGQCQKCLHSVKVSAVNN
jgi:hypothetical protein